MSSPSNTTPTADFGPDEISEILNTFAASGWSGMRLRVGDVEVSVGKDAPPPEAPSRAASALAPADRTVPPDPPVPAGRVASEPLGEAAYRDPPAPDLTGAVPVTSPTVGAFWAAPDPGSPPFVEVGSHVAAGDQLAIVEVMKLMNPVVSPASGEVVAIKAVNAEMVEYGQPLFLIRPDE